MGHVRRARMDHYAAPAIHTVQSYIPIKDGTGCLTGSHCRWATQWLANE
jgi:hypothetical protein